MTNYVRTTYGRRLELCTVMVCQSELLRQKKNTNSQRGC